MKPRGLISLLIGLLAGSAAAGEFRAAVVAIERGDGARLAELLDHQPALITETDARGATLLLHATGDGARDGKDDATRRDITRTLLAAGADVNAAGAEGRTALMAAITARRPLVAGTLIMAGADVAAEDELGRTALHYAAQTNAAKLLGVLVDRGADVAAVDDGGRTALHFAALRFREDATQTLIAAKADVNAVTKAGETAMHLLASHHLHAAEPEQQIVACARRLIAAGVDVERVAADGTTALTRAEKNHLHELVTLLTAKGGAK